jgi:hypothetical protein
MAQPSTATTLKLCASDVPISGDVFPKCVGRIPSAQCGFRNACINSGIRSIGAV